MAGHARPTPIRRMAFLNEGWLRLPTKSPLAPL